MEEKKLEPGNIPENVEREETVAGQTVKVSYAKEDTEFKNPIEAREPEGLKGEELEKWRTDRDNEIKMKRSASDKYAAAAEKERDLKKREDAIDERERKATKAQTEFDDKKATSLKIEEPDFNKILSAKSGKPINSLADVTEVMDDNPGIYHDAKMEYDRINRENLAKSFKGYKDTDTSDRMETALFRQKIESEGINYERVKAFAESRGFPMNVHTLKSFKLENKIPDITKDINKSIPKTTEIKWIPAGDVKPIPTGKTLEEEFPFAGDLEEYMMKERAKPLENQDPRVVAAMKKAHI